ncbi:MAG: extracellular solute-binding protein [Chloroflexi bacterium]|nr:extracellular solute-binding protein [Chloroflexota bacterium]
MQKLTVVVVSVLLVALACAPPAPPAPVVAPEVGLVLSEKPAWERDWEATVAAARKEGEVTAYVSYGPDWRLAMNEVMEKRYGITVNTLTGKAQVIAERVIKEQQNKLYQADVLSAISSGVFMDTYQAAGVLQPFERMLILPEVVDGKAWFGGKLNWFDPDTRTLLWYRDFVSAPILINTELVRPEEMKVWDDLLNPKWKGKIAMIDPIISGSGQTTLTMLAYAIKDWGYIDRLLAQQPSIQRDYRLVTEWVARGKTPILIGPGKEEAYQMMTQGAPIKLVNFQDGSITSGGSGSVAVPRNNPHPNATRVFINFLLGKEGQTITAKIGGYASARVDVPTDFLDPEVVRQPGTRYYSTSDMDYLQKLGDINRRIKQAVAPLLTN